jgi:hypothetical protein
MESDPQKFRDALERFLTLHPEVRPSSFLAANFDLAGVATGPRDLSANPAYLEDFGR